VPEDKIPNPASLETYNNILNQSLVNASKIFDGLIRGPESVFLTDQKAYLLDQYGNLFTASPDLLRMDFSMYIGPGRPLGFHKSNNGPHLVVCDSLKGLLSVNLDSKMITILANTYVDKHGKSLPFVYANDLDISLDGKTVYFSVSTSIPPALNRGGFYDTMASYILSATSGIADGKLLAYSFETRETRILVDNLLFANGVALSKDEDFVVVVESTSMRIMRYWLRGPHKGTSEVLTDSLPGFPDGITRASDGNFWVALILPDNPRLRRLFGTRPSIRFVLSWAMAWIYSPLPKPIGLVLKVRLLFT